MNTQILTGILLLTGALPVAAKEVASAGEVADRLDMFDSCGERTASSAAVARAGLQSAPWSGATRSASWYQRDEYGKIWETSTPYERRSIAESIGEQGSARLSYEMGWEKRFGSQNRAIPQGPDRGYFDYRSGKYRAVESKGGTSRPKFSYGKALQGTNKYMVRSAARVLQSAKTGAGERIQMAEVIVSAERDILESAVVRTRHASGKPSSPFVDGKWDSMSRQREASQLRKVLERTPEGRAAFLKAESNVNRFIWNRHFTKLSVGLAAFGAAASVMSATDEMGKVHSDALLNGDTGALLHSGLALGHGTNALTMTGMTAGGLAELGCFGRGTWATGGKAAGRLAGKAFLPIAVGVEGLTFGVAYYEYSMGQISRRDLYRRSTGPAAFAVCTGGGALIGSVIPGAGTLAGAGVGGLVGIPAGHAADWALGRWYAKADAAQQARVDAHVLDYYKSKETQQ